MLLWAVDEEAMLLRRVVITLMLSNEVIQTTVIQTTVIQVITDGVAVGNQRKEIYILLFRVRKR